MAVILAERDEVVAPVCQFCKGKEILHAHTCQKCDVWFPPELIEPFAEDAKLPCQHSFLHYEYLPVACVCVADRSEIAA